MPRRDQRPKHTPWGGGPLNGAFIDMPSPWCRVQSARWKIQIDDRHRLFLEFDNGPRGRAEGARHFLDLLRQLGFDLGEYRWREALRPCHDERIERIAVAIEFQIACRAQPQAITQESLDLKKRDGDQQALDAF